MACDSRRGSGDQPALPASRNARIAWLAALAAALNSRIHGRVHGFSAPAVQRPRPSALSAPGAATPRRSRKVQVLRRGLPEVAILGGLAVLSALRPRSAPGPSDALRKNVEDARKALKGTPREKLQQALKQLAVVEAQLEAATGDKLDYPLPDYLKSASESGKIMLAITGASGVGKSSLVNALRRVKDTDADAAETGVKETTTEPTMYSFRPKEGLFEQRFYQARPEDLELEVGVQVVLGNVAYVEDGTVAEVLKTCGHEKWEVRLETGSVIQVDSSKVVGLPLDVVIWDLPGAGTPNFPQATYLKRMGIRYFDVALLVTSSRFTEAELMLSRELEKFQVPYFMVRNKVDVDIDSEIVKEEEAHDDEELSKQQKLEVATQTIECIKDYFQIEYGLDQVYCVSARRKLRKAHDFPSLERDILDAVRVQRGY
ncbi:unnamed protein product [Durusdinium trenchii]